MIEIESLLNKITIGDSAYILPLMEKWSVDLVLTDPPYNFDFETQWRYHSEFMRISRHGAIVFSPPENQWIKPNQYLFWIKPISTKNTSKSYSRFVEMIFLYGNLKWNPDRHWSQYTNVFTDLVDNSSLHPFRKPPSLIERLILNHSNEGDLIMDPFAGSGVVAEVCQRLNRNFICIEKDSSYAR